MKPQLCKIDDVFAFLQDVEDLSERSYGRYVTRMPDGSDPVLVLLPIEKGIGVISTRDACRLGLDYPYDVVYIFDKEEETA